jgi:F-type H+-transporting ATPase subunit alpha
MKEVAKSLRLDLAAFRELESFAQLGMDLDPASQRQLERGQRMTQLLVQEQYSPQPVTDQVVAIFAGNSGFLDDLPTEEIAPFEEGLLAYLKDQHREVYDEIESDKTLPTGRKKRLRFLIDEYKEGPYRKERKARIQEKAE